MLFRGLELWDPGSQAMVQRTLCQNDFSERVVSTTMENASGRQMSIAGDDGEFWHGRMTIAYSYQTLPGQKALRGVVC